MRHWYEDHLVYQRVMIVTLFSFQYRPLNSCGFTVCYTVLLPFSDLTVVGSSSLMVFQILSGFLSNSQFPKKTNQATKSPVKTIALSSHAYMKINNSVIFDSETSTWTSPGNDCPMNYQKSYVKHPSSVN